MKQSDKLKNIKDLVKIIESLENKLFSFYKSRDINSMIVSNRIDEFNGIESPLPEGYYSGMSHFNHESIYSYRDIKREVYLDIYKLDKKFEKAFKTGGIYLDNFNVYEKINLYDIFNEYMTNLTKELDLAIVYAGLPERTQEEIDKRAKRIQEQIESWTKDNEMVGE